MQVLNSIFLPILAGAVLIPIIIHLIWRNKAIRVDFPAMRFLLPSQKPVSRWLRWKQLLLLLLRVMIFALLALLFSRPYFSDKNAFAVWDEDNRHVVILYDVSASMSATDHREKAQSELDRILASLTEKSTISFMTIGNGCTTVIDESPYTATTERLIRQNLNAGFGVADLHHALRLADTKLSASQEKVGEIYLISDFQSSNWPDYVGDARLQSKAKIVLVPVSENTPSNIALQEVAVPRTPGEKLKTRISASGQQNTEEIALEVEVANRNIASLAVTVPEDDGNILSTFDDVPLPLKTQLSGSVHFDRQDAFSFDNEMFFILNQNRRTRILAVNGEEMRGAGDELFYLESALNLRNSPFEIVTTNPMQLASKGILGFDIVLLANVRGIDQQSITQINELVEQGGSVVFLLGDKIDQSLFNKFFKNLAGCRVDGKIFNSPESESGLLLLANDREHFIVQKSIESDNVSTRIFQSWQLKPEQDTNTILSFDDGSPALLEKRMGKGRSLVLSFPLDAEWSNFPVQPTFLPLAHSIMHYCTPKEAAKSYYLTGDVISLDKEFNLNEKISINYPGERSETTQLSGGQFNKTEKPGIYQFNQNGKKMIAAVNVDRRESDDIFEPVEKFQSRLTTEGEIASSKRIIRAGNFSQIEIEQKQKFWRVILVILILLVLSETLLANRIPR